MSENQKFFDQLTAKLAALQAEAIATEESRATVVLDQQSVGRLSRMDALQNQAMAKATEQRRQVEIQKINAALQRLEDGEFGYCVECGEDVEAKRMEQDPSVVLCFDCMRG